MLPQTCAGINGCFQSIRSSEGGQAETPPALRKGTGTGQGRSEVSLHLCLDCPCHQRLRPLQEGRHPHFGYILHLLTSRILLNSLFSYPPSYLTLTICVHSPDTHIFLALHWFLTSLCPSQYAVLLKPQFFQYWSDFSSFTHIFSNAPGFMISTKGINAVRLYFKKGEIDGSKILTWHCN